MYDNLRSFFVECVLADHDAYIEARELKVAGLRIDLRLAIHACLSMFHLADHVFHEFNGNRPDFNFKNKEEYWNYLIGLCDDFEMMRDCTNVHKHSRISRPGRLLSSANQLHEVIVSTHYHDEKGKCIIAEKEIRVSLDNGEIKVFHKCLESVRNMWSNELFRLGIIDSLYPLPLKTQHYPPLREHDGDSGIMDLRLKRSEGLKQLMIFQDFNYETMKAEVRNIDPSNLSGAVYRQIHYAKIFISNEKTGCVYNVDVALTEEEKQQFDGLNSESEKNIFFKEIAESREISIESLESKFQQFS
jgi:hypothetical protein